MIVNVYCLPIVSLIYRTEPKAEKRKKELKIKTDKSYIAGERVQMIASGVSPAAVRESTVGRICEAGM